MKTKINKSLTKKQLKKCEKNIFENLTKIEKRLNSYKGRNKDDAIEDFYLAQDLNQKDKSWKNEHEKALERIKNGTYDMCIVCKKPIGKKLLTNPIAKKCISCQKKENNQSKG